jgi:glycosyltransferase involved in cell wall biosynthesis
MKIAYIANWEISYENGVLKKIAGQVRSWQREGHEVKLFILCRDPKVWKGIADIPLEVVLSPTRRRNLLYAPKLYNLVKLWDPDAVYLRFNLYFPGLGSLAKSYPLFVEINSKDKEEFARFSLKIWYWYHLLTRDLVLKKAAGLIFVTHEIADTFKDYDQPKTVISNGIDLDSYPILPAPENDSPRCVFIGSAGAPWHGIDKITWLASQHPEWHFDIVGFPPELLAHESLTNLEALGNLPRSQYEAVMAQADAAFGTLSLHKKRMEEACPLKVREYLAFGIPTIIGYRDTDFPEPVSFLLQLPSSDDNVVKHHDLIEEFIQNWKGKRVDRQSILHLDSSRKEAQRLGFMSNAMGRSEK